MAKVRNAPKINDDWTGMAPLVRMPNQLVQAQMINTTAKALVKPSDAIFDPEEDRLFKETLDITRSTLIEYLDAMNVSDVGELQLASAAFALNESFKYWLGELNKSKSDSSKNTNLSIVNKLMTRYEVVMEQLMKWKQLANRQIPVECIHMTV